MSTLFFKNVPGRLAARLAGAGAILLASGLTLAGAQTTPVAPPPAPAQSPPATPTPPASTYSTTTSAPGATSTVTTATSASAPTTTSQPAPLLGASTEPTSPSSLLQYQTLGIRPAPFGSEMFSSANVSATTIGVVDPGYIMKPGDVVALTLWGSVPDANLQAVIDTNGNVVVPGVGPVKVGGLAAGQIDTTIKRAASAVYRNAVHVYAAPVTTVPITVFMAGPVTAPGPYAGLGSDSVVAFLQRAGGIDPNRGSYRNIVVKRNGEVVGHIDLYAFLRTGELPKVALRNGDVIVVGQQGPVVSVSGAARAPFTFELAGTSGVGEEILYYARPRPEANYVALLGVRNAQPLNSYVTVPEFSRLALQDGDRVGFSADALSDTVAIQVTGAFHGPGAYVVPRQTSVAAMIARIPLDSMADRRWIYLQRASVAVTQKQLLSESLARLQKAIYTTPPPVASLSGAYAAQAQTLQTYINFANRIMPIGNVAFPPGIDLNRVSLEPDDVIVIPFKSQVVAVGGEVTQAQTLIYEPGVSLKGYIRKAGGFSNLADKGHILVIHPDGSIQTNGAVAPGDRILVITRLPGHYIDIAAALTQILFNTALAAVAIGK
ncbi:MAG: polysaccharide biosynthesis/export family protein [Caulobacteraceae bacterium]|nr:polysaccharide biosynthesis/export family protein [Caulobacteraceae bacterium]